MAKAKTASGGSQLLIMVGDGATPEVFANACTINAERGIDLTAETNDINVPDCDDPEAPAWVEREKRSWQGTISGQGVLNTPDIQAYFTWLSATTSRNVRVRVNVLQVDGGGHWSGKFHLTQFNVTGNRGDKVQASITLLSDGPIAWTAAAPV